MEY
ncbi:hypothetical protein D047_0662A, partial [Vibrio parahaemolyticus VPTS-2010_2]|jgi:hypothetical protein